MSTPTSPFVISTRTFRRVGTAAAALMLSGLALPASAVPGQTDDGATTANVGVTSSITLTGPTSSFTLTGAPGATVEGAAAVSMNVETNNIGGYSVTVQPATAELVPADPVANTDVIDVDQLSVRETGSPTYQALDATAPVTVGGETERSAEGGDTIQNDYSVDIPFVNADTYSVTLNYVATTL
ncbi:hypothetical protein [uncultured Friedmanniella sp.]|uniref:hypothetical protein n=1 Tax=uncultured Friedmanniella sp. TaxID=335381 RepID=UPI0035C9B712